MKENEDVLSQLAAMAGLEKEDLIANFGDFMVRESRRANKNKAHIKLYHEARKLHQEIIDRFCRFFEKENAVCEKMLDQGFQDHEVRFDITIKEELNVFMDFLVYPHFDDCLCDLFLRNKKVRSEKNISMIQAMKSSKIGLYQVKHIDQDDCLVTLENMLTREEVTIVDERMSVMHGKHMPKNFFLLRIITWNDISFQTGLAILFDKNDGSIRRWIKKNRNRNRPNEQLIELYNMDQRSRERGTAPRVMGRYI